MVCHTENLPSPFKKNSHRKRIPPMQGHPETILDHSTTWNMLLHLICLYDSQLNKGSEKKNLFVFFSNGIIFITLMEISGILKFASEAKHFWRKKLRTRSASPEALKLNFRVRRAKTFQKTNVEGNRENNHRILGLEGTMEVFSSNSLLKAGAFYHPIQMVVQSILQNLQWWTKMQSCGF